LFPFAPADETEAVQGGDCRATSRLHRFGDHDDGSKASIGRGVERGLSVAAELDRQIAASRDIKLRGPNISGR